MLKKLSVTAVILAMSAMLLVPTAYAVQSVRRTGTGGFVTIDGKLYHVRRMAMPSIGTPRVCTRSTEECTMSKRMARS